MISIFLYALFVIVLIPILYILFHRFQHPYVIQHLANRYLPSSRKVFFNGTVNVRDEKSRFSHITINALSRKEIVKWLFLYDDYATIIKDSKGKLKEYYMIELEGFEPMSKFLPGIYSYPIDRFDVFQEKTEANVPSVTPNNVYIIQQDPKGKSFFGGLPPAEFVFPDTSEYNLQLECIACISREETAFNWLPFEYLYVLHPLLISVEKLYLNYSDPLRPEIIGTIDVIQNPFDASDEERMSRTVYEKTPISFNSIRSKKPKDLIERKNFYGHSGVPMWAQDYFPEEFICPVNGKMMKFVGQFDHFNKIRIKQNESQPVHHYFEYMNFWGDGILYVFMEPESKTVLSFIQNS